MRNIVEAMNVANENVTDMQEKRKSEKRTVGKQFRNWIIGIVISFLPLLALPFKSFLSHGDLSKMLYELFCDTSIMFIGIALTITAMNEFIVEYAEKEKDGWIWVNIILLIFGAIIYTVVVIEKDANKDIKTNVILTVNLIYFVIMFALSASKYIKKICEVK